MDKQSKSSPGFPIWNLTLGGLCTAYAVAGYVIIPKRYVKAKNLQSCLLFVSLGTLYAASSALIYSGRLSKGYATGIVPSVVMLGVAGPKAIFYAGWQAPVIAILGAMSTYHNGKKLYDSLE